MSRAGSMPPVEAWLRDFAAAVRARDYGRARAMFHPDAEGFGTVAERWSGLDQLHAEQWHGVWERTTGFAFDLEGTTVFADGDVVVAISDWSSEGVLGDVVGPRRGRATIVLAGDPELRAVHTHFSMVPGTQA
ncbi:nuclear transport factor 2 family protein [Aeromicrobium sp. NPDC092404]|uniref:YybH family protein n=1 Tax=Aeromicrobium sp. NPDC092404 TaxID=3154976 RepID=UPI003419EDB3